MNIAPMWSCSVFYMDMGPHKIMVDGPGSVAKTMSVDTFDHLYFRLDYELAALKEDCIEYCLYSDEIPLEFYPDWFVEAVDDGFITTRRATKMGLTVFYDMKGGVHIMSPKAYMLRNHYGEIACMIPEVFNRYYEIPEEEIT